MEEAGKVLADEKASQKEVDEALAKLQEAENALDGKETDKTALQKEADKEGSTKDSAKYTNADPDKKSAYDKALEEAKKVLAKKDASQEEVDKAKASLEKAEEELNGVEIPSKVVDKTALQKEADKEGSTKDSAKYTNADPDKKSAYDKALEEAKKVLAKKDASQEEVDKAKASLEKAEEDLNGKDSKASPSGEGTYEVKLPEVTEVKDPNKLTKEERAEIAEKIKKANPSIKEVIVDENGNARVIDKDGSKTTIQASKLVKKAKEVEVANAQSKDKTKSAKNTAQNVKTGVESLGGVLASLVAATSGLFVSKKRKNK